MERAGKDSPLAQTGPNNAISQALFLHIPSMQELPGLSRCLQQLSRSPARRGPAPRGSTTSPGADPCPSAHRESSQGPLGNQSSNPRLKVSRRERPECVKGTPCHTGCAQRAPRQQQCPGRVGGMCPARVPSGVAAGRARGQTGPGGGAGARRGQREHQERSPRAGMLRAQPGHSRPHSPPLLLKKDSGGRGMSWITS